MVFKSHQTFHDSVPSSKREVLSNKDKKVFFNVADLLEVYKELIKTLGPDRGTVKITNLTNALLDEIRNHGVVRELGFTVKRIGLHNATLDKIQEHHYICGTRRDMDDREYDTAYDGKLDDFLAFSCPELVDNKGSGEIIEEIKNINFEKTKRYYNTQP